MTLYSHTEALHCMNLGKKAGLNMMTSDSDSESLQYYKQTYPPSELLYKNLGISLYKISDVNLAAIC